MSGEVFAIARFWLPWLGAAYLALMPMLFAGVVAARGQTWRARR